MTIENLNLPITSYSLPDPEPISMDAYLAFVLFNLEYILNDKEIDRLEPVTERFVLK